MPDREAAGLAQTISIAKSHLPIAIPPIALARSPVDRVLLRLANERSHLTNFFLAGFVRFDGARHFKKADW